MDQRKIANGSIVVGVDTSPGSGLALEWGAHEAARRRVPLQILHAYDPRYRDGGGAVPGTALPMDASYEMESLAGRTCAIAAATAQRLHPELLITTRPEIARPGDALVEAARTAGMIVLGARGRGAFGSILHRSVTTHVAAHARCPVVVVREAATRTIPDARVILGVDGCAHSAGAVRFAFEEAAARRLGLTVVHTWQLDSVEGAAAANEWAMDRERLDAEERSLLSESIAGYQEEFPTVDVRRHVVQSHPVEELVRLSENACLLVVGTRGLGAVAGLIEGSVSQHVWRRAHCPVAIVHPQTDAAEEDGNRRPLHRLG